MFLFLFSLLGILLVLMFIFLKEILSIFNVRLESLRLFLHKNSGIFTLFFITLFFLQQMVLLIFVYLLKVDSKTQLLISIFALIVLTTAALEKFILEKKYQYLASEVSKVSYENERKLIQMKELYNHGKKLEEENLKLKLRLKKEG